MRLAVPALLILATAFAGCGGPAFEAKTDDTVTAGDLLQDALANGQAWNAQAKLTAVSALEVSAQSNQTADIQRSREKSPAFAALVPGGDAAVGDGKARAWSFDFAAPGGRLFVIVAPSGEVTYREERGGTSATARDVRNFTVDSDQASGLAKVKEESFAALLPTADIATSQLVPSEDGNRTEWALSLTKVEGGVTKSVIVRVDARSGDVRLQGTAGNTTKPKPVLPPQESGEVGGSVASGATSAQEFKLTRDHSLLNLALELPNPQPGAGITAVVTAPNGETVQLQANSFLPLGTPSDDGEFENATKGTYTVDVSAGQSTVLAQEFRVYYCTTEPGTGDNPACPTGS